jgi:hypothetical protein
MNAANDNYKSRVSRAKPPVKRPKPALPDWLEEVMPELLAVGIPMAVVLMSCAMN